MRKLLLLLLVSTLFACGETGETNAQATEPQGGTPVVPYENLIADFKTWWQYHYNDVDLTTDFLPLDAEGNEMPKGDFLKALSSGKNITIELENRNSRPCYQLFAFDPQEIPAISATLKSVAALDLRRYQMEGRDFPPFAVEDLNGKPYDGKSFVGKYTVIKTWFIACKPCIVEFPELNEMVDEYAGRDDVQFVSLALDEEAALVPFLKTKPFSYAVVPEQRELIQKDLHLSVYPTHIVVGPDGKILKVVGKVKRLRAFLATI